MGQAAQPLLSIHFGANNGDRINQTLKYALQAVAFFSIVWTALILLLPKAFVVYIHGADAKRACHCAPHYEKLCDFLFAAAAEYFFHLFISNR